jgi:hypothetical protein
MFWIFILGLAIGTAIGLVGPALWNERARENQSAREDEMARLISAQRRMITDMEYQARMLRSELAETDEQLAVFLDQEIAAQQQLFAAAAG